MKRGLVVSFPSPWGLTEADLERLYHFVTARRGAQIDIVTGPSRRTSAILAIGGHQLRVERDGQKLAVRNLSGRGGAGEGDANDGLGDELEAALLASEDLATAPAEERGRW